MMQSALLGGAFIGILSALPIVNVANCCCLWIVGGGFLTAYLEQQREGRTLPVGRGALVGLSAGVIGAIVWLFASIVVNTLLAPLQQQIADQVLRSAADMPPEAREWLERFGERASSPFRYLLGFLFQLGAGMMFATLGGVLGAAYFNRDVPPAIGGDPIAPPPPPLP
jgi:hypothetical protein